MPGRHEAPDSGPFLRELAVFLAILVAVGIGLALLVWGINGFGSSEAAHPPASTLGTTTSRPTTTTTAATTTSSTVTTVPPTTTTAAPTTTTVAARAPSEVVVLVLNATNRPLLAARVTEELRQAGYQTLEPDNAQGDFEVSRVWYTPGFAGEAGVLAARFPDGLVEPTPEAQPPADIVVVLGDSYEE
jgi:hypothetical protein